jgi:hypothetical protein
LEAAYASSDFSDESGKFVADDRGDLSKDSYVAFKDMEVGAANPHSLDLDFDFVQVRLRLRDIPKFDVSLAFRIFDDRFHGSFSSLQKRS